jgi:hypothetical protein
MNHKMKNIAVAMFAALLLVLSTAIIVSGHIVLADGRNSQEIQQTCGTSCTASNVITGSRLMSPSPQTLPSLGALNFTRLTLTVEIERPDVDIFFIFTGKLIDINTGAGIGRATIKFTELVPPGGRHALGSAVTDNNGNYDEIVHVRRDVHSSGVVFANYAGMLEGLAPAEEEARVPD